MGIESRQPLHLIIWVAVVPVPASVGLGLLISHRSDYLGHYLAGYGASLVCIWLAWRIVPRQPIAILAATVVCVLLGFGAESTVFRIASFDLLDFYSQSLGAVFAGLAVLNTRATDGRPLVPPRIDATTFAIAGVTCLALGFDYAFR